MYNLDHCADRLDRNKIISIIHFIIWMLLVLLVYKEVMLPALSAGKSFGFTENSTQIHINDFASHFNFAKEVWSINSTPDALNSVYSVDSHLHVTSKWAGRESPGALPFGYSPTMLWLLAPLALFSHATAFCIFNSLGLLSVWWQTRPIRCRFGIGILSFFSPLFYDACMALGQTALITGACLLYVSETTRNESDKGSFKRSIYTGIAIWVLTAKPPLAVTAGAALMALKKWQPLVIALGLTLITTLLISPLLGINWTHDYVNLLSKYDLVQADKAYTWSLVPYKMSNLRSILHADFNVADNFASRISTVMWFFSLICMVTLGAKLRLQQYGYWALSILFYLLFCPHVSPTEEIQLILLIPLCVPVMKKNLNLNEFFLFAFILFLPFMSPAVGSFFVDVRWGLFTAKIFLVFFIVYHFWVKRDLNKIS